MKLARGMVLLMKVSDGCSCGKQRSCSFVEVNLCF